MTPPGTCNHCGNAFEECECQERLESAAELAATGHLSEAHRLLEQLDGRFSGREVGEAFIEALRRKAELR